MWKFKRNSILSLLKKSKHLIYMNYGFNTQIIIIHGEKMNPMIKGKFLKKNG